MTRKEEILKYLKNRNYPNYITKLEEMCKDPKFSVLLDDCFGGKLGDIQLKFSDKSLAASRLLPTQNAIGLESSLKHGLTNPDNVKKYFTDKIIEINAPIVTFNDSYVIDGHHRWSEILCFNPKAKISTFNYDGDLSPIQMLKASQGAIAAAIGEIPQSKIKGKNLYKCDEEEIAEYIDRNITDEVTDLMIRLNYDLDSKDDVIEYLTENCLSLVANHPIMSNAPERDIMPQIRKAGDVDDDGSALNRMKDDKVLKI